MLLDGRITAPLEGLGLFVPFFVCCLQGIGSVFIRRCRLLFELSDRIGRIMQDRESVSINSNGTSISRSKQLEAAVPPSKIATLSSGEMVGLVADDPDNKIDRKAFHCEIQNDHQALKKEEAGYKEIPEVRKLDNTMIQKNYEQIKQDIQDIIAAEMERLMADPELAHLVVKKN